MGYHKHSIVTTHPLVLLLPTAEKYHTASIESLIFLAIEKDQTLTTGEAIADEISNLTNGLCRYKQPYISKTLQKIQNNHIIARDKIWTIEKFEGTYKLIDLHAENTLKRKADLKAIPFDRSTVFRNNPISPTIFGFKLNTPHDKLPQHLEAAESFFLALLDHNIFQTIKQNNVLYILLDSHHYSYSTILKILEVFIDKEYLLKAHN